MMKAKAKRLDNGEWVEGYYVETPIAKYISIPDRIGNSDCLIDPKTLCQQVRETDFFEGDEIEEVGGDIVGLVEWDGEGKKWQVFSEGLRYGFDCVTDWKPTGKNIHDKEEQG
jgi:hypothetical protein